MLGSQEQMPIVSHSAFRYRAKALEKNMGIHPEYLIIFSKPLYQ